jgi:hypothetical protein
MPQNVMKDQTHCPKCGWMYCEGYWGEGVCLADMAFSLDPTSAGDEMADYLRRWYEINRETWWDRHRPSADRKGIHADNFILRLIGEVSRIQGEAEKQKNLRHQQSRKNDAF